MGVGGRSEVRDWISGGRQIRNEESRVGGIVYISDSQS